MYSGSFGNLLWRFAMTSDAFIIFNLLLSLNSYFLFLVAKIHVFLENTNKKKEKMKKK
ncbi:Uncharacterised protein [Segatella copri]|nr:Uncharacterised protein [Segatella copri]